MPVALPFSVEGLVAICFGGLAILVPIVGLTARFALRPIVEAIARMKESQSGGEALHMVERRMDLLEQEVQSIAALRDEVARLAEAQEFQLRLSAPVPRDDS
jgi:hypothetical protein